MNKNILILAVVVLVSIGVIVVARSTKNEQLAQKTFSTQSDSQGEVSVEVTPTILEGGREASFQVTLETHSVELDQDLGKVSKLIDDQGNEYLPVSWSGGIGGHHLSGDLIFPKISENVSTVELKISGIGGFERVFKWEL